MASPNQVVHDYNVEVDELVGLLFFKAMVAMYLTQANVSYEVLRFGVSRYMQSYNYDAAEEHLRTIGVDRVVRTDGEPRRAVLQMVGFIFRFFSASGSHRIMQELLSFGRGNPGEDTVNATTRAPSDTSRRPEVPGRESPSEDLLPRYTSILYEEGCKRSVTIDRRFSVVSLEPPQIRATVTFGALQASRIGRSKKIAGHMAAKDICDRLNFVDQLSR